MKALLFTSKENPLRISETKKPVPGKGEVLIRLSYPLWVLLLIFERRCRAYSQYRLHPVIDKIFLLDDIAQAFEYMNSGKQFGKIMLKIF